MTSYIVGPGSPGFEIYLSAGDTETVEAKGTATETTISSGGVESILSGGLGVADVVLSGGELILSAGGQEDNAIISAGGAVRGLGVLSGDASLYGVATDVTVGVAAQTNGFSSLTVFSQGIANSVTVIDSFASISSGGVTHEMQLVSGAVESVGGGATATGTVISAGGVLYDNGSTLSTVIGNGSYESDFAGAISRDTLVHAGGQQIVFSFAVADDAVVYAGGGQYLGSRGSSVATVISNGGELYVSSMGYASATQILSGGTEQVLSGGYAGGILVSSGGTLIISGGGYGYASAAGQRSNGGTIDVDDGGALTLGGTFVNSGVVAVSAVTDITSLMVDTGGLTLMGAGVVKLSDSQDNQIIGNGVLTNVNNTIEGSGKISGGGLSVINSGVVDADGTNNSLFEEAGGFTNDGVLEAGGAGNLVIAGVVANASGSIVALGGSVVFLDTGTTIYGGILEGATGVLAVAGGQTASLEGSVSGITIEGDLEVADTATLNINGVIDNNGGIFLNGSTDPTALVLNSISATLSGSGSVHFTDAADNNISGAVGVTLYNDNYIDGAANIGVGKLTLINSGTIDASATNNSIILETTSTTNYGLIEATGVAGLSIQTSIDNLGTIAAAGGDVTLDSECTISGGVLSGDADKFTIAGAVLGALFEGTVPIVVLSGGVLSGDTFISGATAQLQGSAAAIDAVVSSGGVIAMSSGGYVLSATLVSGGTISGPGMLEGVILDAGYISGGIVTQGAVLSVTAGTEVDGLSIASGGVVRLDVGANIGNTTVYAGGGLSGGGQIISAVGDHGDVSGLTISSGGKLTVAAGATAENIAVQHYASLVDSGVLTYSGGAVTLLGTLTGAGSLVETGAASVLSQAGNAAGFSGQVTLSGGTIDLTAASGLGTASIAFEAAGGVSATLQIGAADAPTTGATFASELIDFNTTSETLDLTSLAFVSGATAKAAGGVLTLKDGTYTAKFDLGGTSATTFTVTSDGHGGTLVTAGAVAMLVHAIASFDPGHGAAVASGYSASSGTTALLAGNSDPHVR